MPHEVTAEQLLRELSDPRWPVLRPIAPEVSGGPAVDIALNLDVCVVGDRCEVNLPLRSPLVSKVHAIIVNDAGALYVRDLASRNGLFVNGGQVREADLLGGDLLQIGSFTFRCASGFDRLESSQPLTRDDWWEDTPAERSTPPPSQPPGAPAAPRLTGVELQTPGFAGRIHIEGRTVLLGRRAECDVSLADNGVCPVHAVIFRMRGRHFVRDLASETGTHVNGVRVKQAELCPGDRLRLGGTELRYLRSGDPPPTAMTPSAPPAAANRVSSNDRFAVADIVHPPPPHPSTSTSDPTTPGRKDDTLAYGMLLPRDDARPGEEQKTGWLRAAARRVGINR